MSNLTFYLNGKFVKEDDAKVSILDLGFVRGFGIFDFLRTYNGKPFKLKEHLLRFQNSAKLITLPFPWKIAELEKLVLETLKKNQLPEANIKIIATGGLSADQITPGLNPTLAIVIYPPAVYPQSYYEKGVKVVTVSLMRAFADAKTLNYIPAMIALEKARREKAVEALYKDEKDFVYEGTTTNFFLFKGKNLITPKDGILEGITRKVVLKLAEKEFKIELRPVRYKELEKIDEAFICASNKEIMPVVQVDSIKIGNGRVGPNTKRLMELFKKLHE